MGSLIETYYLLLKFILGRKTKSTITVPKKIGNYKVVKILQRESKSDTFVALLSDDKNKKVVAKVWQGKRKNHSYISLKREYQIYKILHQIISRITSLPNDYRGIKLPKLIDFIETTSQAALILEYVSGKTISHFSEEKIADECFRVSSFVEFIGDKASNEEKKLLGQKSYSYHFALYLLFLVKAAFAGQLSFLEAIQGLHKVLVFSAILVLYKKEKVLVHGDLNFENLIIDKGNTYLLDFQFTTFSYREYGYANTLRYAFDKGLAKAKIQNLLNNQLLLKQINQKLLQSIIVIHATQGLTATNFSKKVLSSFHEYLSYGINSKNLSVFARQILCRSLSKLDYFFKFSDNGPIVLCYHSFANSCDRYSISVLEFESQVRKILEKDKLLSLKKIIRGDDKRGIAITIDDGLKSVLCILPVTVKYKIPVTLFILAEPEKANRKELNTSEDFLSWSEIKSLHKAGWEIGCHSATHVNFSSLSKKQIEQEVVSSKKIIEKKLGVKINTFAYPKGIFSEQIKNAVKKAGYLSAYSVLPGRVTKDKDNYLLPRTIIDKTHSISDFPSLYSKTWLNFRQVTSPLKLWERFLS